MKYFAALILAFYCLTGYAQTTDTTLLKSLLYAHPDLFSKVLSHTQQNEVQLLYTQIERDRDNKPHFESFSYRLNDNRYFYPASTVKLPTLIFALERLNQLNIHELTRKSIMITDSSFTKQSIVLTDTSSVTGKPSIEQYIKKILLVSDNDAYNRLYEFVGREEINRKLKKYGLENTRIIGRLAVGDTGENTRHTNAIDFYNAAGKLIYHQPPQVDRNDYPMQLENMRQGNGYLNAHDSLVMQPYDFSDKNVYTIHDQQQVLKRLMFPEAFSKNEQFNLTREDYQLVYKYMSMYPTESIKPTYSKPEWHANSEKFLFYGADSTLALNPNIRIYNKIGDSYGYMIDNAYIVDFKNKVEFMLTAVIQSNEDGIYNDNRYEYATVCLPFLKNIGQIIYQYELKRKREHLPDLSKFKFKY